MCFRCQQNRLIETGVLVPTTYVLGEKYEKIISNSHSYLEDWEWSEKNAMVNKLLSFIVLKEDTHM